MTRREAIAVEFAKRKALLERARDYAIESAGGSAAGGLVAGAMLRIAAKEWHAAASELEAAS